MDQASAVAQDVPLKQAAGPRTIDTYGLKRQLDELRADRTNVEQFWNQIDRFIMPLGSLAQPTVAMNEQMVDWNRWEVWDGTGPHSAQLLAATIHGNVTSPQSNWFGYEWRDQALKDDQAAVTWLDKAASITFDAFQDSDFNVEIQGCYQDLVAAGNGILILEPLDGEKWKGLDFTGCPLREGYFVEDSRGDVLRFWRKLYWSPAQVLSKFGADCPEDIRQKAAAGNVTERIEIVWCVFQRPEAIKALEETARKNSERRKARRMVADQAARTKQAGHPPAPVESIEADEPTYPLARHIRPHGCCYFRGSTGDPLGEEDGYYDFPVFISPWQRTTGSRWGHGPGNSALPTVKMVNTLLEADTGAAEKALDPSLLVTERGLLGDVDLKPGGITVVRSKDDVTTLESKARFDVTDQKIGKFQAQIRDYFHVDELQLKESPQMTAMEVQVRYERMQRLLGAPLNRIETKLLSPAVLVAFNMLLRAGRFPQMPQSVQDAFSKGGAEFNIHYLGPLARAQRTDQVASIERLFAFVQAMMKMGFSIQLIMAMVDIPKAVREMGTLLGVPAELIKDPEEVEKQLKALDQAAKRAAEAETSKTEGEAAQAHANAAAALQGPNGGGAPSVPVPAQPPPVVGPSYGPQLPFKQPGSPPLT